MWSYYTKTICCLKKWKKSLFQIFGPHEGLLLWGDAYSRVTFIQVANVLDKGHALTIFPPVAGSFCTSEVVCRLVFQCFSTVTEFLLSWKHWQVFEIHQSAMAGSLEWPRAKCIIKRQMLPGDGFCKRVVHVMLLLGQSPANGKIWTWTGHPRLKKSYFEIFVKRYKPTDWGVRTFHVSLTFMAHADYSTEVTPIADKFFILFYLFHLFIFISSFFLKTNLYLADKCALELKILYVFLSSICALTGLLRNYQPQNFIQVHQM